MEIIVTKADGSKEELRYMSATDAVCAYIDQLDSEATKPTEKDAEENIYADITECVLQSIFVSITQAYLIFRRRGFSHLAAREKVGSGLTEMVRAKAANDKPRILGLLRSTNGGFMTQEYWEQMQAKALREAEEWTCPDCCKKPCECKS